MRPTLILACIIALVTAISPALAKSPKDKWSSEDFRNFIEGNTLFTLYHEFGHALIHEFDLPVLGREEDAVDSLATLIMMPDKDAESEEFDRIVAAASGWLASHLMQDEDSDSEPAYWDEHGLDMQRFYATICLLYGADPDSFADLAEAAELPESRRESCSQDYQQSKKSWASVLKPHWASDKKSGKKISIEVDSPPKKYAKLAKIITDSDILKMVAKNVENSFVLPRPLTLRMTSCDEANAFFSPNNHSVTLCYELLGQFSVMSDLLDE